MNKIEYGTEFLDQLKDKVHDLHDRNKKLTKENINLKEQIKLMEELCNKYEETINMLKGADKK